MKAISKLESPKITASLIETPQKKLKKKIKILLEKYGNFITKLFNVLFIENFF
jgi:hypothetical protein